MNKDYNIPLSFDVTVYGDLQPFDDSKSKARVRIFYRGLNRNRTYISEDFSNQLIASLPYAPVKGIFNSDDVDFEEHGNKNAEGKIYGLVMAEPNFAWEDHLDSDGITRTYACADVLLYTSLYNEAKLIPNSSQSMEINPYTYQGEWRIWEEDGKPYYYFKKGSLFGLQVLGTQVEPCFEGAAFYNLLFEKLQNDFKPLMEDLNKTVEKEEEKMDKILFRLSDNEKAGKIWELLNPNFNAENGWKVDYCILDVYDEYAVVYGEEGYKRAYYTKSEDNVTVDKMETCYITDVTETEMNAFEAMKAASGSYEAYQNSYNENVEKIATLEGNVESLTSSLEEANTAAQIATEEKDSKITELEASLAEKDTVIAENETKYSELEAEKVRLENSVNDLTNEKEELVAFKTQIETDKKEAILQKYTEYLTESVVEELKSKISDYSVEDFKKEVCTAAVESDPTIFEKKDTQKIYFKGIDEGSKGLTGVERILDKYKNGGKK